MTRRISCSRPITGSSLPSRASAVRSRVYFSSAWNFDSGVASVARRAAHLGERLENLLARDAGPLQNAGALAVRLVDDREQQVLGREVLVLEPFHFRRGRVEQPAKARSEIGLRPVDLRQLIELGLDVGRDTSRVDADLLHDGRNGSVGLLEQREEQVLRRDFLVLGVLSKRLRLLDRLLCLLG